MEQNEQIFNDLTKLLEKYDPSYISDTFNQYDHVLIFNDGVLWSRPLGDKYNRNTFHVSTNFNYIEDKDNVLDIDYVDDDTHAKKVFDTLIGIKEVELLNDDTLINIVHNEANKCYGIVKNNEDYELIVSIVGQKYVKHIDTSLYDAMQSIKNN